MTTTTARPETIPENHTFDIKSEDLLLGAPLGRIFGLDSQGQGRAVVNVAEEKKSRKKFAVKRFSNFSFISMIFKNLPSPTLCHKLLNIFENHNFSYCIFIRNKTENAVQS